MSDIDDPRIDVPGQLVIQDQTLKKIAELVVPWVPGPKVIWRDYPIVVVNRSQQSIQTRASFKDGVIRVEVIDRVVKGTPPDTQVVQAGQSSQILEVIPA